MLRRRVACSIAILVAGGTLQLASLSRFEAAQRLLRADDRPSASTVDVPTAPVSHQAFLAQYCFTCHNQRLQTAGLELDRLDLSDIPGSAEVWERVVHKVRTDAMPPPGARRPEMAAAKSLATWLETTLDRAAAAHPTPGRRPAVHRLNRAEYSNAIRDLLDVDIDAGTLLPHDDSGYGFDNIADVLSVSPMLTERYLSAARKVARLAVGDPTLRPVTEIFSVDKYLRQSGRTSEDLPFGSRGGLAVRHYFPVDAEYVVQVYLLRTYDGQIRGLAEPHPLEIRLDGRRIEQTTVGGSPAPSEEGARPRRGRRAIDADGLEVRFSAKAGSAVLAVTFAAHGAAAEGMLRKPYPMTSYEYAGDQTVPPAISRIELRGPFNVTGRGDTPSRQRIFIARPTADTPEAEEAAARQILSTLARRAYRRPVGDEDVEPLVDAFAAARRGTDFDASVERALRLILVSPDFLFRVELDPPGVAPGAAYQVSDIELASRLSFFLWSSIPDDELLELAQREQLHVPTVLQRQVRRMLDDERASALATNFGGQWLYLRNMRLVSPDPHVFPDFDANLREALERETQLFFESQVREDRPVPELLTADYTFVNERLARHYGLAYIYGDRFRRVTLADDARRGLLGKGSILTVTSYAHRTSPVVRGKWLLENLLGAPPPPPPAAVPPLAENDDPHRKALSVRERLEQHRESPACANCHKIMDPLGFALENFDGIGRWRTEGDGGTPIDASGTLVDGTAIDGPASLRDALLREPENFVATVAQKLLTYALGRGVEYDDGPAVRQILRDAKASDYRWSALIEAIVMSTPFQMRSSREP